MSDEQTIEAVKKRNEERRAIWRVDDGGCEGAAAEYLNEAAADIDFLLSEIEARDAEIERLRAEIAVDDKLLAERNRILEAHPCPVHGPCVPYVLNTIKRQDGDCDE